VDGSAVPPATSYPFNSVAANHTITATFATVTPVTLTGTRVYDGTTTAASSILSVANAAGGDTVTVASGSATLASGWVGNQSIASAAGLTLGGAQAYKYTLTGATGSVAITNPHNTFSITSVSLNSGNVLIGWTAVPGVSYQLLGSTSLTTPLTSWGTVGAAISATGTSMSTSTPVSGSAKFFSIKDVTP